MVKVGIIGLGGISVGIHIPQLKKVEDAQITAICDVDKEKLKKVGDDLGIPEQYRFTEYCDLIHCNEVDAVEICTPNYLHVDMACEVIKSGKPVNLEKPLDISGAKAEKLMSLLAENPVTNMMTFSYRFMPAVRYAKHIIKEGMIGDIINVNIEYNKDSGLWPGRRMEWRFYKEFSGSGVLCDLGVHLIDLTRFLLGDFESVYAVTKIIVDKRKKADSDEYENVTTDDVTSFIAELSNGAVANFLASRCAIGHDNSIKYEIYGTKGVISVNLNDPREIKVCAGEIDVEAKGLHTVMVPAKYCPPSQEQSFIDAVNHKNPEYLPTLEDGVKCQKIVDAVLKSSETHERIVL